MYVHKMDWSLSRYIDNGGYLFGTVIIGCKDASCDSFVVKVFMNQHQYSTILQSIYRNALSLSVTRENGQNYLSKETKFSHSRDLKRLLLVSYKPKSTIEADRKWILLFRPQNKRKRKRPAVFGRKRKRKIYFTMTMNYQEQHVLCNQLSFNCDTLTVTICLTEQTMFYPASLFSLAVLALQCDVHPLSPYTTHATPCETFPGDT